MTDPDAPTFRVGRIPGTGTRLPYVLRLPVSGEGRIFLATRESWPRGTDLFCHQIPSWPDEAEVVEEVPIEACWRAGAAVHLVLRRRTNRRSLFVWTRKGERTLVFWRSEATMRRARPGIRVPLARAFGESITIAVDVGERYPWRFTAPEVTTERRRLPVGDYALLRDHEIRAVVERKTTTDFATAAVGGQLGLVLAELGQVRHAALVIEGRLSDVLKAAERVKPGWLLNVVAALQVEHPRVSWMFAETRPLAEAWAYRWLAAAARIDAPRAVPLFERAIGEVPASYGDRPKMLDATARRALLATEAEHGTVWTSRAASVRHAVTRATAVADLTALVRDGRLQIVGRGRARTYVAVRPTAR
ncbi:MAG TPA: ERCC4 domain-containing protein [Candidatus Limnocylindria bacterium]|nr:ERCC4 domain-containing protein [Candidatus Limnocylindria bacterium]